MAYNESMRLMVLTGVVAFVVLAGCGGGGTGDLSGSSGGGGTMAVGPLLVSARPGSGQAAIVVGGNGTCNLYAASGAKFTSVITNLPHTLDNTFVEASLTGQIWTAPFSSAGQL